MTRLFQLSRGPGRHGLRMPYDILTSGKIRGLPFRDPLPESLPSMAVNVPPPFRLMEESMKVSSSSSGEVLKQVGETCRALLYPCLLMWIRCGFGAVLLLGLWFALPGAEGRVTAIRFRNVAASAVLRFVLENDPTPRKHLVETMAGGVAAFDYDGDGLTDIYFANGASLPSLEKTSPRYWNRLYRNLGGFRFQDVTESAGVAGAGYSIGAAWFDYDNDGLLDLFVVNYVRWSPEFDRFCGDASRPVRVYCHPQFFEGLPNTLYHNEGNGKFKDVSQESGIASHVGKGMGVAVADYDRDGLMDVFAANDKKLNFLFHNPGHRKFEHVAFPAGAALLDSGNPISGMGVDFRDYNNDGLPDVALDALAGETFPLIRNTGAGLFDDATYSSRMGMASRKYSGWGIGMFDFNNDGWKDLFTANSHVNDRVELFEATEHKQHNAVFLNRGDGSFQDVSETAGRDFLTPRAHRGAAFADFNNDGRIDAVVSSLGEGPELWENVTPGGNSWLILKLEGTRSNRDGIGAAVRVDGQSNHMTTAMSYASSSHFGVHFGTGRLKRVGKIQIRWPSGTRQALTRVPTNQVLRIREP